MKNLVTLSVLLFVYGTMAIKQSSNIVRQETFKGDKDALKQDTALVRVVDPMSVATLVQTLFEHSISLRQSFYSNHEKAEKGSYRMGFSSYKVLAQSDLNVLMQDYMPMNEADLAAAMFMFAIKDCKLKPGKEIPQGFTACEYHGARFLQDIVHRTGPIHNALTFGQIVPQPGKKSITMEVPPQWNEQVSRIVANLGTSSASRSLEAIDPFASTVWNSMRESLARKS